MLVAHVKDPGTALELRCQPRVRKGRVVSGEIEADIRWGSGPQDGLDNGGMAMKTILMAEEVMTRSAVLVLFQCLTFGDNTLQSGSVIRQAPFCLNLNLRAALDSARVQWRKCLSFAIFS